MRLGCSAGKGAPHHTPAARPPPLQIALVRALKEQHVAERTAVLRAALQADLDEDLAAAARLPPLPAGGSGARNAAVGEEPLLRPVLPWLVAVRCG